MRVLFLDDDENRHRVFARRNTGNIVDHVWTARECIRALEQNPAYDLVSLDHDLDMNLDLEKDLTAAEETGADVAEYIRLHLAPEKYPAQVVVHSWNPPGAARMASLISETGIPVTIRPFPR